MTLTITPVHGSEPLAIYSVTGQSPTPVQLDVTTAEGGPEVTSVTWTLQTEEGVDVQDPPPIPLGLVGGRVTVPIFATAAGDLTLQLTDVANTTSSGALTIASMPLNSFSIAALTATPRIGEPMAYAATIRDSADAQPAGIKVTWSSDSSDDTTLIPAESRTGATSIAGQDVTMTTTDVLATQLTTTNQLTVTATLGENGPPQSVITTLEQRLRAPSSLLPLPNGDTINDTVIDAITINNDVGGLPFLIPEVKNYSGKSIVILLGNGRTIGVGVLDAVGEQIFPKVVSATLDEFNFTGPMQIVYQVVSAASADRTSESLDVQVKRKEFPNLQSDSTLPRPRVSTTSYTKVDRDKGTNLQVTIPLRLDPLIEVFAAGDIVAVQIELVGYTSNNEGQVLRRPVGGSGTRTLIEADVSTAATQLTFDIDSAEFDNINGSLGSVSYTLTRTDPGTGSSTSRVAPSQAIAVDTVDAFSASSVFHISHIASLIRQF